MTDINWSSVNGCRILCERITRYWTERGLEGAIAYPVSLARDNEYHSAVGSNVKLVKAADGWRAVVE